MLEKHQICLLSVGAIFQRPQAVTGLFRQLRIFDVSLTSGLYLFNIKSYGFNVVVAVHSQ